jgi:type II secretory pathway pseudopilin PulG
MLKQIMNTKGMSILEVMIAAGMAAIVSLGLATMMQNSMVEQKKSLLFNTLKEQKARIEFLLRDQNSWNQTVNCTNLTTPACPTYNSSAPFTTLRSNSTTVSIPYATPVQYMIMDAAGALAMNLLGPATMTGNGFTESGVACTTFNANAGAGNDACPISYRLLIGATCPATGSCVNPQLKLVGRLVFNPSPNGPLIRFKNLVPQVAGSSIADTVADGKYDAVVKRTASRVDRTFSLVSSVYGASAGCVTSGAGRCTEGTLTVHPLPAQPANNYVISDTNGLVSATNAGISFNENGLYSCLISVSAFATLGFTVDFTNISANGGAGVTVGSATTQAGYWAQTVAVMDIKFNVTQTVPGTPDVYVVRQMCEKTPVASGSSDPNIDKCSLGMAANTYPSGGTPIITINCYKADSVPTN